MLVPKLRFKREDGTDYPEWEEKTLQDVSSYITTTGIGEKSVYVGTENMRKDCSGVVLEDNNDTTVKGIQYALNDVLVSNIRPYLKKAWKADRSGICSTDVLCIRGTSEISSDFLYTLLSSDSFFEYVMQGVKGTKMPRGDKKHIMEMPAFIPCLEEQQKIADFLSTVDEVIAQSEAEVQNLEQQKKAAMQKIFSQEVRFKREDGTEYPEWAITSLNDVCDIIGGGTPSTENDDYWNGDIQWFTPSEIGKTKYVSKSARTISQVGFEKSSARKLPAGTILLTSRATLGEMAIATTECTTNQGFQSLIPQKINSEYLYYLQPVIKNYCNKKACGSTFNEISKGELGKCKIPMPDIEEQQKIADFLSAYDDAISYAKQELDKWKELKKGLLQQIFV